MVAILDDVRRAARVGVRRGDGALTFAVSGTGTSGMEAAVANLTTPGTRALVVVTGYFGDRLAQMLERYGATVTRVHVEWGRACDPAQVERALAATPPTSSAVVHAETSTGVVNPGARDRRDRAGARRADDRRRGDVARRRAARRPAQWGIDVCYSCTQKGLGAPSGLAPITFSRRALVERRAPSRSFYLDLALLEDYWVRRKYHHTISAPLVYALHEALDRRRRRRARARAGRGIGATTTRLPPASTRSACRCCRHRPNGSGRSTPSACPTALTKRRCGAGCSRVQHRDWRGARSARRARSGAWA